MPRKEPLHISFQIWAYHVREFVGPGVSSPQIWDPREVRV